MADYSNRNRNKNDAASWILPILLLFIFPPAGILWLALKLFSGTGKKGRHPYYTQRDASEPLGVRTTMGTAGTAGVTAQRQEASFARIQAGKLTELDTKGKRFVILGAILLAVFGLTSLVTLGEAISWLADGYFNWFIDDLMDTLPMLCFTAGGGGVLWAGLRRRKQVRLFRRYLAMIGKRKSVSISVLAETVGKSEARVFEDLEDMLNDGLFPQGFLDYGSRRLVVSGSGVSEPRREPGAGEAKTEAKKKEDDGNAILTEIRQINDAIKNEKLSAQIDRIGVITAKILEYQKSSPAKAPQLHSFLSYYLPTTLKILRAYAKLEAQEVSGQNITSTMERIEGMMDKVVEGFEKQLDMLFQGDAMDITTDVEVLERMLAKDGLSDSDSMPLSL